MPQKLDERHPFMHFATWCTLLMGLGFAWGGINVISNPSPDFIDVVNYGAPRLTTANGVAFLLGGIVATAAAIYVLNVTKFFARYSEASAGQQALAGLVALPGSLIAATLIIASIGLLLQLFAGGGRDEA
ncbi:MAG: hypothetical protein ACRDH9_03205 [Actinomycetota bacterium]